uniref:Lysosome-associated membrane glycoprotein 2 n=1 Tax=Panagrellus redivivus TaxID=6233 RepID=A0A7E4VUF2_PANRE
MTFLTGAVIALLALSASALNATVPKTKGPFCIIFSGDVSGIISYETHNNETKSYKFKVPTLTDFDGQCLKPTNGSTTESLKLRFYPNDVTPNLTAADPWTLEIVFKENAEQTNNAYAIDTYSLHAIFYDIFVNATEAEFTFNKSDAAELEWAGERTLGFKCSKTGLALTHDSVVSFEDLKVLAFAQLPKPEFPEGQGFQLCKLDIRTSDVVPIVVGACLAGLVIVVLIAYLVGRARARRQGYASV